jgi:Pyruvate/2-oxoacid:ferredoxin oxidoreductase gamma subunit
LLYDSVVPVSPKTLEQFAARNVKVIPVPASQIAQECGESRAANTALFAVMAHVNCTGLPEEYLREVHAQGFAHKPKALAINREVYDNSILWLRGTTFA